MCRLMKACVKFINIRMHKKNVARMWNSRNIEKHEGTFFELPFNSEYKFH